MTIYRSFNSNVMNKLAIPSLLLGVIMVAGAFAFMPVQEASTVHTTIQGTQQTTHAVTSLFTTAAAATPETAVLNCSTDCIVTSVTGQVLTSTVYATTDRLALLQITADTVAFGGAALTDPGDNVNAASATVGRDLIIAAAVGDNAAIEYLDGLSFPANALGLVAAGADDMTLTVEATVLGGGTTTAEFTAIVEHLGTAVPSMPAFAP